MILVVDNYDSFTFNLVQLLLRRGLPVEVLRNDVESAAAMLARDPSGVILSPGPGRPEEAGECLALLALRPQVPLLGVCLGHQAIAAYFGAALINIKPVAHGQPQRIRVLKRSPLYRDLPDSFTVGLYHSWVVDRSALPSPLEISAEPFGI